jgi:hypothetical protein
VYVTHQGKPPGLSCRRSEQSLHLISHWALHSKNNQMISTYNIIILQYNYSTHISLSMRIFL